MDDLEIVKRCAEAMGYETDNQIITRHYGNNAVLKHNTDGSGSTLIYDPLHNDAQKWVLAEKFPECMIEVLGNWRAAQALHRPFDMGSCLCECIAKTQAAK